MHIRGNIRLQGIVVVLCLVMAAAAVCAARPSLTYPVPNRRGDVLLERAKDFSLKDLQGRTFRLAEQKGNPVLLVFGATWCPYCLEEIPRLKSIYATYGKHGFILANVDIKESRSTVARFADKHKLPYPVLLDESSEVAKSYGVRGIPDLILIDRDGMILCRQCRSVEPLIDKMFKP